MNERTTNLEVELQGGFVNSWEGEKFASFFRVITPLLLSLVHSFIFVLCVLRGRLGHFMTVCAGRAESGVF